MSKINEQAFRRSYRSGNQNGTVAQQCLVHPELLKDVSEGFNNTDKKIQFDCIEVFTIVARKKPDLVIPYSDKIIPLLKNTEVHIRREATHSLAYIATGIPDIIHPVLPLLENIGLNDESTIVRDHVTEILSAYAIISAETSREVFPILKRILDHRKEEHAKQVLKGFGIIAEHNPEYKAEIRKYATSYLTSRKKTVTTEAAKLIKKSAR